MPKCNAGAYGSGESDALAEGCSGGWHAKLDCKLVPL
jgi:hypothetical protein